MLDKYTIYVHRKNQLLTNYHADSIFHIANFSHIWHYMARLLTRRPNLAKLGLVTLHFEYCDVTTKSDLLAKMRYIKHHPSQIFFSFSLRMWYPLKPWSLLGNMQALFFFLPVLFLVDSTRAEWSWRRLQRRILLQSILVKRSSFEFLLHLKFSWWHSQIWNEIFKHIHCLLFIACSQ
jgi:hypothetical protein